MNIDIVYDLREMRKTLAAVQATVEELKILVKPKEENEWLDTKSACRFLKVSERTVMNYKSAGIIPYSKVGGRLYFRRSDLTRVLENGRI